jgi:NTP pyrophosphatase (non-canonical NTP hydrolase)
MNEPDYTIGAERWPGLAKLTEECGELLAVAGRLQAFPDGVDHPDRGGGSLEAQLEDEMADVQAAINYVVRLNGLNRIRMRQRRVTKLSRFRAWHIEARR